MKHGETFWLCVNNCRNPAHHYLPSPPVCQTCGAAVKKIVVDDTASLRKLLDIRVPKAKEKRR